MATEYTCLLVQSAQGYHGLFKDVLDGGDDGSQGLDFVNETLDVQVDLIQVKRGLKI